MLSFIKSNLKFYRIHFFLFIAVPLVLSAILYASNGKYPIEFIDSLFICISAATGTGFNTTDLSSLTAWQQAILAILEITGNQVFVSWVVVYFRRQYFLNHLEHIVSAKSTPKDQVGEELPSLSAIRDSLLLKSQNRAEQKQCGRRRKSSMTPRGEDVQGVPLSDVAPRSIDLNGQLEQTASQPSRTSALQIAEISRTHQRTSGTTHGQMNDFSKCASTPELPASSLDASETKEHLEDVPDPQPLILRVTRSLCPGLHHRLQHAMSTHRTETLVPQADAAQLCDSSASSTTLFKPVSYLSFRAIVGRNSVFRGLSANHIEDLGGIEYRALTALLWIVPLYYGGLLAISFVVIAPYMTLPRWQAILLPPEQHRKINPIWLSAFQVAGAWSNTGMSLVDQNMVPFQTAYPMIIFLVLCVLAGNSAFPIFLRFMIWIFAKVTPRQSRFNETLQFLLDHPRRCFIYLFPSSQTWVLFTVQLLIDSVAFAFDLILNIGNPATASLPVGVRIINAVLAAAAVRTSGFQSIAISTLAPAVQVLDVVLMYITIYPIALSVRSTNVYEERALGIYEDTHVDDHHLYEAHWKSGVESRLAIWGKYILRHARKQLAFDMWWLALSLFLLCIIERTPLMNVANASWFNIWALIFEVVSAYGTVGLSLGVPYAYYSLSGALRTPSKLILCAVMIRGRHRGLPVALDRAVMYPREYEQHPSEAEAQKSQAEGSPDVKSYEGSAQKATENIDGLVV